MTQQLPIVIVAVLFLILVFRKPAPRQVEPVVKPLAKTQRSIVKAIETTSPPIRLVLPRGPD